MIETFVNQKRRIVYFALSLTACTFFLDLTFVIGSGIWGAIFGLLCATCLFAAVALAFIMSTPRLRGWLELIAFASTIGTIVGPIFGPVPISGMTASVILSTFLVALFNTRFINRITNKTTLAASAKRYIPATKDQIWNALVPGESHPDDYFTETLRDFSKDNEEEDALRVFFSSDTKYAKEQKVSFLVKSKGKYCRYYFEDEYTAGHFSDGVRDIKITTLENNACFVAITDVREGMDPSSYLRRWFDNYLARDMRRLVAHLDKTHGENSTQFDANRVVV